MTNGKTVFLFDGTYTVFRSYYAISRLTAPDGTPTNAVYGFVATIRKILRDHAPEHIAVAFDLEGPTHRDELFAEYKANREPPPEDLVPQFALASEAAEVMGWPVVTSEGYEADDVIAALAHQAREKDYEVVIVTADKDLYQLVREGVRVLNPAKDNRMLDDEGVEEVFGVRPERVIDVLALMGDKVDNVPGVPGIGEKTARDMVLRYGGIEPALERAKHWNALWNEIDPALELIKAKQTESLGPHLEIVREHAAWLSEREAELGGEVGADLAARFGAAAELSVDTPIREMGKALRELKKKTQPKVWNALAEHEKEAMLSRQLVTIPVEVPVTLDLDRLAIGSGAPKRAAELFRRLGFRTLTNEMEQEAAEQPGAEDEGPARAGDSLEVTILDSAEKLEAWISEARESGARLALDTETDSLESRNARLVGVSLAFSEGGGAYLPVGHRVEGAAQLEWEDARTRLAEILGDASIEKVGQNLKYDLAVLHSAGLEVCAPFFDTLVAAQLIDPGRGSSNRLDDLAQRYLGDTMISYSEVSKGEEGQVTLDLRPVDEVARYAVEDAVVAWRLAEKLEPELEKHELATLFREVEAPLVPVLEQMERIGIRVDRERLESMSAAMSEELASLEKTIHELAGHEFNIKSPQQLRVVLFEELGLSPSGRRTQKTKQHSTGQEVLESLADQHELPGKVLEYREVAKLQSTYVDALPQLIENDGRVHTRYHQLGAATGRLSSSDPNLQNIPIRTQQGRLIREAFVPEEGRVFVSADYSQMELRILAHVAGDPTLIEAFRSGMDIHTFTAAAVAGIEQEEVTPELRARAKAVNFGIIYGMSEFRLAREQGMSREDARAFIDAYFARYSRVRGYIESVQAEVQQSGVVRTIMGRLRRFPELEAGAEGARSGLNRMQRDTLLRQAVNTTIQGSGADIVKRAMVELHGILARDGSGARMLLQVHDELLVEVPASEADRVLETVTSVMESAYELAVPLAVDARIGSDWSAAH